MSNEITVLLNRWTDGDDQAMGQLTPLMYQELKLISERVFRSENAGHTLQPTALISELYLKLDGSEVRWNDRNHFYALAARLMRRILVNHARAKNAAKRGGGERALTLHEGQVGSDQGTDIEILSLDMAMSELAGFDARKADLLELHYFCGLTHVELAEMFKLSQSTIDRDLRLAKAWLNKHLSA